MFVENTVEEFIEDVCLFVRIGDLYVVYYEVIRGTFVFSTAGQQVPEFLGVIFNIALMLVIYSLYLVDTRFFRWLLMVR